MLLAEVVWRTDFTALFDFLMRTYGRRLLFEDFCFYARLRTLEGVIRGHDMNVNAYKIDQRHSDLEIRNMIQMPRSTNMDTIKHVTMLYFLFFLQQNSVNAHSDTQKLYTHACRNARFPFFLLVILLKNTYLRPVNFGSPNSASFCGNGNGCEPNHLKARFTNSHYCHTTRHTFSTCIVARLWAGTTNSAI